MKLSEAIRLGALLKPQSFDGYTDGHGTCALGAALDAVGRLLAVMSGYLNNQPDWIEFFRTRSGCPACQMLSPLTKGQGVVIHLNDEHRWTREQIADWVESVEQAHESTPVTVEAVTA